MTIFGWSTAPGSSGPAVSTEKAHYKLVFGVFWCKIELVEINIEYASGENR